MEQGSIKLSKKEIESKFLDVEIDGTMYYFPKNQVDTENKPKVDLFSVVYQEVDFNKQSGDAQCRGIIDRFNLERLTEEFTIRNNKYLNNISPLPTDKEIEHKLDSARKRLNERYRAANWEWN
tara:strand:+ start:338 stop:706 length:369 start_codon:yes stop_codon:yes gene_type:complete